MHAVGPGLPGVFGDLPAIFPGDLTEDGTQIEQGVLAHFGARKIGSQTWMQLAQGQGPGANGTESWPGWLGCGTLEDFMLVLLSIDDATQKRLHC